jgi:predicted RNA-binding protein with PIN domain
MYPILNIRTFGLWLSYRFEAAPEIRRYMARRVFIDGTNVIRTNLSLARVESERGIVAAEKELLRLVREYQLREGSPDEYMVAFDGIGEGTGDFEYEGAILVVYSIGRTADEVIMDAVSDALALNLDTLIVSSDAGVRVEGSPAFRAEDFYDELIRRTPEYSVVDKSEESQRLISRLVDAGHLPQNARNDRKLSADLASLLEYFALRMIAPNKLTKKLETFFRENSTVSPSPDPQKLFFRTLKSWLEKANNN